jgi:hypothetical protein
MVAGQVPAYVVPQRPAIVPDQARHQMSRYERGRFFEVLCGLRDAYAERSDDDRRSSLLINDAVTYAEAVMLALDEKVTAADLAADAGITTLTIPAGDPRD